MVVQVPGARTRDLVHLLLLLLRRRRRCLTSYAASYVCGGDDKDIVGPHVRLRRMGTGVNCDVVMVVVVNIVAGSMAVT